MRETDAPGATNLLVTGPRITPEHVVAWDALSLRCNQDKERKLRFDFSPSLLKSLVQKNARMGRPMAAVRCALQLCLRSNFQDFLRRLSIIVVEDAILHPMFPWLVWLTVACSKGLEPTAAHVTCCMRILHDVARVGVKDHLMEQENLPASDVPADEKRPSPARFTLFDLAEGGGNPTLLQAASNLSPAQLALVKALLVRAALGGMKCDVAMLRSYARLWLLRFAREGQVKPPPHEPVPGGAAKPGSWLSYLDSVYSPACVLSPQQWQTQDDVQTQQKQWQGELEAMQLNTIDYLQADDIILSAVDFHCSPLVDMLLREHATRAMLQSELTHTFGKEADVPGLLKSMVWHHRSSLTSKLALPGRPEPPKPQVATATEKLFQTVQRDIDGAARSYIASKVRQS